MRLIAHRGNTHGPNPARENEPDYLLEALDAGFDVECDVRLVGEYWWLGHDGPQYRARTFLHAVSAEYKDRVWFHAKDPHTLAALLDGWFRCFRCFYHSDETLAVAGGGYIWTCDRTLVTSRTILMDAGRTEPVEGMFGLCSDYVGYLK